MLSHFLDSLLLVTTVVAPWVFLAYALSRFRDILRRDWWVLLLLGVAFWLLFTQLLSPLTETPVQAIFHSTTKPWFAAYVRAVLVEHHAPLWLPQLGTGLPSLANPYVAFLSPFTSLLLLFADLDQGVNVFLLAQLTFTGLTGYLLGRSLGFARATALLVALPVVWNPWVFRRLTTEIHALYVFGFTWMPLAWALGVRFLRTRALGDALAVGIPLAFMAISMPTVFAYAAFAVAFFVGGALLWELFRRRWRSARHVLVGGLLIVLSLFLTAAPEHLAARELFQYTSGTRFERTRITGGWRDRDFSVSEFLRVLLPHRLGATLIPLDHHVDAFGVPFSPGDAVVVISAVGAVAVFLPRWRRSRMTAALHLLLFITLFSLATHGPAYEPVFRFFPFLGFAGVFPGVGAPLLLIVCVTFGFGIEAFASAVRFGMTRLRIPGGLGIRRALAGGILTVGAVLLVAEQLWGIETIARRAEDPDGRPDLRLNIPSMPLQHLSRLPHMALLAAQAEEEELPLRIHCTGDRPVWPPPCFDYAIDRARTELVGVGELAWAMPRWQWRPFTESWSASDGTIQPFFERLLRLASVERVVHTRDLPYPLVERVAWEPNPGNFELFGKFLGSSIGGGVWKDAWDGALRIYEFPGNPRVFFANAILIPDDAPEGDATVQAILQTPTFDPQRVVLVQGDEHDGRDRFPLLPPDAVTLVRAGKVSEVPNLLSRSPNAKLRVQSPHAGAWVVDGHIPKNGALLFSQMYYPGMRATVNGQRVPVFRADLFLSAVPVPKGEAHVTLEYAPTGILASGILTAGFAVLLALSALRRPLLQARRLVRRPRERSRQGPP